jgi:lipoprotein-anchoring transpeptidase ErfK/SrfK
MASVEGEGMRALTQAIMAVVLGAVGLLDGAPPAVGRPVVVSNGIVVSLSRQRLYEYHQGRLTHVLPVSTASGHRYFSKRYGRWVRSATYPGHFRIRGKVQGWKRSEYGRLYYPNYYDRAGRAIHGYRDVRPHRSHGCIRIPMRAARGFFRRNPIGTPVIVE